MIPPPILLEDFLIGEAGDGRHDPIGLRGTVEAGGPGGIDGTGTGWIIVLASAGGGEAASIDC